MLVISGFLFWGVQSGCFFFCWVLFSLSSASLPSSFLLNTGDVHFHSVCQHTISAKQKLKRTDEFNDGVGGRERREREGPAELMNHTTAFMEIPTATHVLLGQRATDLLFPVEPTNHNLLSTGQFNSLVTSSSYESLLHGGFTNALILQSRNMLLI